MKIQRTLDKAAQRHSFSNCEAFTDYLRDTLIPDLKESGQEQLAQDFQTAHDMLISVQLIERL